MTKVKRVPFVIRVAMADKSNICSIWMGGPNCTNKRNLIKIKRATEQCWHWVFVDARAIDENFAAIYSERPRDDNPQKTSPTIDCADGSKARGAVAKRRSRYPIAWQKNNGTEHAAEDTIVASEWYRAALRVEKNMVIPDLIYFACWDGNWYGWLRAACQGPDPVVRLGTRLGVLGAWLGFIALADPINSALQVAWCYRYGLILALGIGFIWACRGRPKPLET